MTRAAKNTHGLTPMEEAFCREFLVDKNGAKAAVRAGSTSKDPKHTAYRFMHNPLVLRRIHGLMAAQNDRVEITADLVLSELRAIATSDLAEFFDEYGDLRPIHDIPAPARRTLASVEVDDQRGDKTVRRVKLWDKLRALELLGKHLKLFHEMGEFRITAQPSELKTVPEIEAEIARLRDLAASGGEP